MTPENRFTAPVKKSLPLKSETSDWYDATEQGLKCYREKSTTWNDPDYGEDCLNLNIYMPEQIAINIQNGNDQEPVPVFIWIHGGAFFLGSNRDDTMDGNPDTNKDDPSKLAIEQNVIVVKEIVSRTFFSFEKVSFVETKIKLNYRLGSLGFLFLESAEAGEEHNGNWAVLDQILAMQWVTDHIAKFGGDLTRRTLSGCSAGGQSVFVHLTEHESPAQALFDNAIVCAAPTGMRWFTEEQAVTFGNEIIKGLGFKGEDNTEEKLKFLRELDVVDLLEGSWGEALLRKGPWHESLRYRYITQLAEPYAPVIDEKLVTGQLYDFVSEGKIEKETIIEYSTDEGETFIALVFDGDDVRVSQETWHTFLNTSFNGNLRDNLPNWVDFTWPEDFKQCSVGDQDCFQFMMDFSVDPEIDMACNSVSEADPSKIECWDQASNFLTAFTWTCATRHAVRKTFAEMKAPIYELEIKTIFPDSWKTTSQWSGDMERCDEKSCHCIGPFYSFGNYEYWNELEMNDDEQARFGKELRNIYGHFMRKEPHQLTKTNDLKENEVNLLSYNRETGTKMEVTSTFKVCTELDKMDFYSFM